MAEDNLDDFNEVDFDTDEQYNNQNILDSDFLLLILVIVIFFSNTEIFSSHFQLLDTKFKKIKNYLDMADATIQALDQASQIPSQMLDN